MEVILSEKDKDLLSLINLKNSKLTRVKFFDLLAEYTYKYYKNELGDILKIFPKPVSIINDWSKYNIKKESNNGKEIEQVLINYSRRNGIESDLIRENGTDLLISNVPIEVKSSKDTRINRQLNSSFYKNTSNKFYIFANNTDQKDIIIRTVSSQLLFRLALGKEIYSELSIDDNSETLKSQIKNGLDQLDFEHLVEKLIVNGESIDSNKSFHIGDGIKVRFHLKIEPK